MSQSLLIWIDKVTVIISITLTFSFNQFLNTLNSLVEIWGSFNVLTVFILNISYIIVAYTKRSFIPTFLKNTGCLSQIHYSLRIFFVEKIIDFKAFGINEFLKHYFELLHISRCLGILIFFTYIRLAHINIFNWSLHLS
jgi:hypothetical protein